MGPSENFTAVAPRKPPASAERRNGSRTNDSP
jgi:hypothetical protein